MAKSAEKYPQKIALITGAATGIGRETSLAFAQKDFKVVISDINKDELLNTKSLIERSTEGEAEMIIADVSDPDDVKGMTDEIMNKFGRLDAACNNAGVEGVSASTGEYKLEDWDKVLNVNLRGQFLCMKHEIEIMLKTGGGSIINVSSILGIVGFGNAPAYTAAKHGLIGLTKAAAIEYAPQKIRINAVCPGFIDTPMLERAGITKDEDTLTYIRSLHPMARLGKSEEVANVIVWLASEEASFITGHPLMVDGGYIAR
ncbi:MAG: SDR family oxidoreductase [Gracilimonas sp.]|uniref:SDR family oxidoreductase n=1 Tax=Gracilimonas sp. TaxID=1974203 RepID=UPI00198C530F|nr:SDR family oxidoreductase [Gracilimonas sp.]MBD3616314.1 SDR family oxidoreductase [Gracilimonas sp.]